MSVQRPIEEFAFRSHPSQDFLRKALHDYAAGRAAGKIYVDPAATGTGKSWALTNEPVSHIAAWEGKPLTLVYLAPEWRHLNPIHEDLKRSLVGTSAPVIVFRSQLDTLEETGIPKGCPLRKASSDLETPKLIQDLERGIELLYRDDDRRNEYRERLEKPIRLERDALKMRCRKWIESQAGLPSPDVRHCQTCRCMYPGNEAFQKRTGPMVVLMTYQKLFWGLSAFEIDGSRARFFTYSPFVSEPTMKESPFPNCFFVGEEFSHGHKRITDDIEKRAIKVNVFEAASFAVRGLADAFDKTCLVIESANKPLYLKYRERLQVVRNYAVDRHSSFWLPGEVHPYANGRACVLFRPDEHFESRQALVAAISPAFSSLFSHDQMGARLDSTVTDTTDGYRVIVKPFKSTSQMRAEGCESVPVSAAQAIRRTLEPIADVFNAINTVDLANKEARNLQGRRPEWAGLFLKDVTQGKPEIAEYIATLPGRRSSNSLDAQKDETLSVLDQFYLRGYEFIEAGMFDGHQLEINVRLSKRSTESMVNSILKAGNGFYVSSASATVRSAITNIDLDWLALSRGHPLEILPLDEGKRVLEEKTGPKAQPEIVWGSDDIPNVLNLSFGDSGDDSGTNVAVLNAFARDLADTGIMAPRCSLLFFNSGRRAAQARDAFGNYLKKTFGEGSHRCEFIDAKSFHGGAWKDFHADFGRNLASSEKPKIYLVFVAFGGMATGANLHQELLLPLPENANFYRYVGGSSIRRHTGSDRVGVDVSDVVLAEQVTNVVSENNYQRIGHHLAAKGDFTWLQIGHKLFGRKDAAEPWWATSAAVKQTSQYVAAQLDIAMQSVGRMDRTLNSSYTPKVFLNSRFAGIFAAVTPEIVGETILPPAMRLVLESAKRQLRVSEVCVKTDFIARADCGTREFFSRLAQEVRDSFFARDLWIELRDFLSSYVVITGKDFLSTNETAVRLNRKLTQYGVSVTDFYFAIPPKAVFSKLRDKWGLFFTADGDEYCFYDPDFAPVNAQKCWYRTILPKTSGYVMMVRPAAMFDVVWPSDYERTCRVAVTAWARKRALEDRATPLHLFERSDIFVPQCGAAVDAKAWSVCTMEGSANIDKIEQLIADARMKLGLMKTEANGKWVPERYVYAFKNWWPALEEKYGRVAVFFDGDGLQNDFRGAWDVAFVHVQDYAVLTEILDELDTVPAGTSAEVGE